MITGIIITIVIGIVMYLVVLNETNRPNIDEIYRKGYIAALDSITRELVNKAQWDKKARPEIEKIFNEFLKPEYERKTASCQYNLPWK
jgi:hypothetical protein